MMKKVLAWLLVLALTAAISIGATLAYLTDTDEDVNVMTLGKVKIDQLEYERVDDETANEKAEVQEFHDNKPLYPAVTENGFDYTPGDTKVDWTQIGKDGYTSNIWDPDKINNELFEVAYRANACANMLGPIIGNLGNILYVILAMVGCLFLVGEIPNVGLHSIFNGFTLIDAGIIVSFLSMAKQFAGNINQVSQQINSVVMAMAGAERVFTLMDADPEADDGYVTLVDAEILPDGTIREVDHHTGVWAWKHPHSDGTLTYTKLEGDVTLDDVDFAYEEGKNVLHNVTVFAKPGQKVAFVGSTGAGKTTITNLINRFYDIEDGKIRYDGININKR